MALCKPYPVVSFGSMGGSRAAGKFLRPKFGAMTG